METRERSVARWALLMCAVFLLPAAQMADAAVTIAEPSVAQIVQRSTPDSGSIVISGTYNTPSPDRIEARAVVMTGLATTGGVTTSWQTIVPSPSGGVYSGTLTGVKTGGWYQIEVADVTGVTTSPVATRLRVGIGDVYITAGAANSANHGSPTYAVVDDRVSARVSVSNNLWQVGSDPQPFATGSGGSPWSRLGDMIVGADGLPVGFLSIGVTGSTASDWIPGTPAYDNRLRDAVQSFSTNGFRAILWHHGEEDSLASIPAATYASQMTSVVAQSRIDAGWDVPWYIAESTFNPGVSLEDEEPVGAGQRIVIHGDPLVYPGPGTDEFHLQDAAIGRLVDTIHFNATGLLAHAEDWFEVLQATAPLTPANGDFEDNRTPEITGLGPLSDGGSHTVAIAGDDDSPMILHWRILSETGITAADGNNGIHNPDTVSYAGASDSVNGGEMPNMSGRHVAILDGGTPGNYFLGSPRARATSDMLYTLTVALGVRDNASLFGGAMLSILTNGVPAASATFDKSALDTLAGGDATGSFTDASVSWYSGSLDDPSLQISVAIAKTNGTGTILDFDNVRLTNAVYQIAIEGDAASNVGHRTANFNGTFTTNLGGFATDVSFYWGTTDGGTNKAGWDMVTHLGPRGLGPVSTNISGLLPGIPYFYRVYVTNQAVDAWSPITRGFTTLSPPVVESAPAYAIGKYSALLPGNLGPDCQDADVTVFWGTSDAGTNYNAWGKTNTVGTVLEDSTFDAGLTGLSPDTTYYYACYATNDGGEDWSTSTRSFTTLSAWNYWMQISFPGYSRSETLTNFPVLVQLDTSIPGFDYGTFLSGTGDDLRFWANDESVHLNHEVEQWNPGGTSYVWVQVPELASGTQIRASWAATSDQGVPAYATNGATWSEDYQGALHLGPALGNSARTSSPQDFGSTNATGAAGSCRGFDGASAYVAPEINRGWFSNNVANFTVSLWARPGSVTDATVFGARNEGVLGPPDQRNLYIQQTAGGTWRFCVGASFTEIGTLPVEVGQWQMVTLVAHAMGATNQFRGYVNGDLAGQQVRIGSPSFDYDPTIGNRAGEVAGYYFDGLVDECRVSGVGRSSNWVWAVWSNTVPGSSFTLYGQARTGALDPDDDGDEMPDNWEILHFSSTNAPQGAPDLDWDNDGASNQKEYVAGTDPTDKDDSFCLDLTQSNGQLVVTFPTYEATGTGYSGLTRMYRVEWCTNLSIAVWELLENYTNMTGLGQEVVVTNMSSRMYYRAKTQLKQ